MNNSNSNADNEDMDGAGPGCLSFMAAWARVTMKDTWEAFTDPVAGTFAAGIDALIGGSLGAVGGTVGTTVLGAAAGIVALPVAAIALTGILGAGIGLLADDLPADDADDDDYTGDDTYFYAGCGGRQSFPWPTIF